ncbi:MAG: VOC family protein [bacterium]|nr:VOC family protein [bacterium]
MATTLTRFLLPAAIVATLLFAAATSPTPQEGDSEFSRATIDVGVVVSDLEKSAAFYKDVIGFAEVPGFSLGEEFCRDAGLTDGHGLKVRVLMLAQDAAATRLKLMSPAEVKMKPSDNAFVHSQLGFSYITVHAKSLAPVLERLEKAGVATLAKGPIPLPGVVGDGPHLAVVRDPDGNLVELIGVLK